ncbi:MAG TPA: GNAT family N-acetyltransferase [Candidatus Dormibacteraeota bacterium]
MNDVIAADGNVVIRRMRDDPDDYRLIVSWRNQPHVREWWDPDDPPLTIEAAVEELRPSTQPAGSDVASIIEVGGAPVGYLQFYPWDAEQDYLAEVGITVPEGAWGLDIFIGERSLMDRGIGSRTVRLISDHLFAEHDATAVALATEVGNSRAQAAYVRAGMRVLEQFLDTDTRDGRRVESVLMIRDRPDGTAGGR